MAGYSLAKVNQKHPTAISLNLIFIPQQPAITGFQKLAKLLVLKAPGMERAIT